MDVAGLAHFERADVADVVAAALDAPLARARSLQVLEKLLRAMAAGKDRLLHQLAFADVLGVVAARAREILGEARRCPVVQEGVALTRLHAASSLSLATRRW